jgi:hypothetical protein
METLNFPLNDQQLHLLKMFSKELPQEDWENIRKVIVEYLASKLEVEAEKASNERHYTNETFNSFLNEHLRTPYNNK